MIYSQTWGDINTASSRLRVFNIQPHIKDYVLGSPEDIPNYDMSNYQSGYKKGDVLIIQKLPIIDELRKAQKAGCKVIYDLDDDYLDRPEFKVMIEEADLVTVDTEEKKKLIPNAIVIPDSLDWDGTIKEKYEHKGIIGWTGYSNGTPYLNEMKIPEGMKLRLITDNKWLQFYKDNQAQSRPWSLEMVDKYLSECDLGVYFLPGDRFDSVKGMHKLLKNWAIGLPTYTTAMPDYVKAMHEAGVGDKYIIKTGEETKDVEFDPKLREYALKYSAENIAKLWKKTIGEVLIESWASKKTTNGEEPLKFIKR